MAEVAVHLTLATLPSGFVMLEIDIPDDIQIKTLEPGDLPDNWNRNPPTINSQKVGDKFIDAMVFCVLKVPSVVVPVDHDYLINPHHEHFEKITIIDVKDLFFDVRIL